MTIPSKNAIEQIEQQMWRRAQELWGITGPTSIEAFDPIVKMLIGAQAVEVAKIQNRIETSQKTMISKLAELIMPDVLTLANPASTVLHIEPREADFVVDAEFQVSGTSERGEIYFSPAGSFQIWNAPIEQCYLLLSNSLIDLTERTSTANMGADAEIVKLGSKNAEQISKTRTLIIGLDIPESMRQLPFISFYFDFLYIPTDERNRYLRLLNSTRWFMNDTLLQTSKGIKRLESVGQQIAPGLTNQLDISSRLEEVVCNLYRDHFITVYWQGDIHSVRRPRPPIMDRLELTGEFDFTRPMVWLEVQFPAEYSDALLKDNMTLQVNCVPALNRRLHSVRYTITGNTLNIVPIKLEDQFLTIKEVRDSHGRGYQNFQTIPEAENAGGTYYLRRSDITRMDSRDVSERLREVIELAKDEYSRFAALNRNDLLTELSDMLKLINKIEKGTSDMAQVGYPLWHLFAFPGETVQNYEELFITFWSTVGRAGNGMAVGAISGISSTSYRTLVEKITNLLPTAYGGDRPAEEELLDCYRNALLTRQRIVTVEDIKSYCREYLGNLQTSIEIAKGIIISESPAQGLIPCIDVIINPSGSSKLTVEEWLQHCHKLQAEIENRWTGVWPVRVRLAEKS